MKVLRVTATVYDRRVCEYVHRTTEVPVSDDVIKGIQKAMRADNGPSPIKGYGFGDTRHNERYCPDVHKTPLRDHRRFCIDASLSLVEIDDNTGEEKRCGGWKYI